MTARKARKFLPALAVGARVQHVNTCQVGTVVRMGKPEFPTSSPYGIHWDGKPDGETMAVLRARLKPAPQ